MARARISNEKESHIARNQPLVNSGDFIVCIIRAVSRRLRSGGGFQAGVIFASGVILYALLHGIKKAEKVISLTLAKTLAAIGLLLYAGTGLLGIFLGGNYLDYNVLAHDPTHGQHWGIFFIELGVGITVATVMISIFYAFAKFKK